MEPKCEDTTPELSESLRNLGDSNAVWARLINGFLKRLHIPVLPGGSDKLPQD